MKYRWYGGGTVAGGRNACVHVGAKGVSGPSCGGLWGKNFEFFIYGERPGDYRGNLRCIGRVARGRAWKSLWRACSLSEYWYPTYPAQKSDFGSRIGRVYTCNWKVNWVVKNECSCECYHFDLSIKRLLGEFAVVGGMS